MKIALVLAVLFISLSCTAQQGKRSKIYIVRHAEKLGGNDPLLTDDGNKRTGDLAGELNNKGIKRIYVTEFKRTQNTADSLRILGGVDTVQTIGIQHVYAFSMR